MTGFPSTPLTRLQLGMIAAAVAALLALAAWQMGLLSCSTDCHGYASAESAPCPYPAEAAAAHAAGVSPEPMLAPVPTLVQDQVAADKALPDGWPQANAAVDEAAEAASAVATEPEGVTP